VGVIKQQEMLLACSYCLSLKRQLLTLVYLYLRKVFNQGYFALGRFVGWVEARNPTNTLGFASLNPTYKKRAKVLLT